MIQVCHVLAYVFIKIFHHLTSILIILQQSFFIIIIDQWSDISLVSRNINFNQSLNTSSSVNDIHIGRLVIHYNFTINNEIASIYSLFFLYLLIFYTIFWFLSDTSIKCIEDDDRSTKNWSRFAFEKKFLIFNCYFLFVFFLFCSLSHQFDVEHSEMN